jgi:hypothetical protein
MKKLILFISIISVFAAPGCKKLADENVDPNNPPIGRATPQLLIPSAILSTAGQVGGEYAIIGGLWAQYYTQSATASQYRVVDAYNINSNLNNNVGYLELYRSALSDYQRAQVLAEEMDLPQFYLMATVMKAYTYHILADLYDQIPYTEALRGIENLQPAFDEGFTVYQGILNEIDVAMEKDFKRELNPADVNADVVFGGDMDAWERFANTLKLKLYLRMVNAQPAAAEAGVKALYAENAQFLMEGAGITSFEDAPNASNPFYEQNIRRLNTNDNLRASVTFVSWLLENNDPRVVTYFGSTNPGAIHQGDYSSTNPAYPGAAIFQQSPTDPVWFISEAESYFLQAEALERYFSGTGAEDLYEAGVTAAFAQEGLTPGGLLTGAYAYPSTGTFEEKLEAIIVQKWASFPGTHDLEGFFEQNRTGYPRISPVYSTDPAYVPGQLVYAANGVTNGEFPRRLIFPDVERGRNANTPPEVPVYVKPWYAR